ncbi:MAG: Ada metal-binding domain-containing protein [Beijerinckiaceae bacterium]|nr:Ada metal-binding domain-containing protein [Beijerinckiaceae bacterium]
MPNSGALKLFKLLGADGRSYDSPKRGAFGGHRGTKVYGLMTCKTAARYVAAGTYQKNRVFFADEAIAITAGYRPCGSCMPGRAADDARA